MLEQYFRITERGSTMRTEVIAGLTTFLTMAYIAAVNPGILAAAGMDQSAAFVATCLAAAYGSIAMGLLSNYPIALAPGMGLNAYFTFFVVKTMGFTWQVALGAVWLSGVIFVVLSILPVREQIINAIPRSLKMAIGAGIGMFLGIIALKGAGVVVAHPATFVTIGDLTKWGPILCGLGFILIVALDKREVPGAIIIGILAVTVLAMLVGQARYGGIVAMPPSPAPVFMQLDIAGALKVGLISIVFAFLFVDLFDTAGTLVGVLHRAGLLQKDGTMPSEGLRNALLADSTATVIGAMAGTSTTTCYIESAAGIKAGGRTGLTAVVVGLLFLLTLFLAPLATSIPAHATAPALLFVACMMARGLVDVDWDDVTEYAPAVVAAMAMPFTFSIAHGIALGFITYAGIKFAAGRAREVHPVVAVLALLFVAKFAWL
ncbi:MAG: NCS2 family permease [Alphaproteobacteria bacterium]|nr:NCS2 family permease [Alphaproteobacteria bacterium]